MKIFLSLVLVVGGFALMVDHVGCRATDQPLYEAAFEEKFGPEQGGAAELNSCIDSRRWMLGGAVAGVVIGSTGLAVAWRTRDPSRPW